MIDVLVVIEAVAFAVLGGLSFVRSVLKREPGWVEVIGMGAGELVLLVQAVIAIVGLSGGHSTESLGTFVLYLVASLLIFPVAIVWATAEKSRWSGVVLGVAFLSLIVIVVRMQQVWAP